MMKSVTYLLIGGGLASQRAAAGIRQYDRTGSILLVGQERHLPYDRPPLSKEFLQGKVPAEKVFLQPADFYHEKAVDLVLGQSVEHLDIVAKTVRLSGASGSGASPSGETVRFEKALIATGGRPIRLSVPGADLKGVHYLRTFDDCQSISGEAAAGRKAVIVGGGFIGLELASSLTQRGVAVTLLERGDRIWRRFADGKLAAFFQDTCTQRGVTILTGEQLAEIRGTIGQVSSVVTASGKELPCDFVCVAVGIVPNVELAAKASLAMGDGILVNERLQTSHPDIYAAGDVIDFMDPHSLRRRRVEHWGHADAGGTLAGENMAGGAKGYDLLAYVWSDIFDVHLEFAGDEKDCQRQKLLMRGSFADKSFAMLYLDDAGRMTAYFAVNYKRKQYLPLQNLIKSKMDFRGREAQLQDPAFDVATLLSPQPAK
jgi:3-phenylpropionate/trans-cinnamate dioxygenase ferredoxin reductase component